MDLNVCDVILLICFILGLVIFYGNYKNNYFKRNGIKSTPAYPFFGHFLYPLIKKEHIIDSTLKIYSAFPEHKYVGTYSFTRPSLMIRDLNLIKLITIKDFDHFHDHQSNTNKNMDPVLEKSLVNLEGQKWKDMRATLSPAFTSSKMKNMFSHVIHCGEHTSDYYVKKIQENNNTVEEVDIKEIFNRYTNDVIASVAFGIKIDSLSNKDNEFFLMGKSLIVPSTLRIVRMIFILIFPRIAKIFKQTLLGDKISTFFRQLISNQIKQRDEGNIVRQDMIHLLIEAKKGLLKHEKSNENQKIEFASVEESETTEKHLKKEWDNDDIVAQAVLFFLAGFETAATTLSFLANELAINQDIQKRLQAEIDNINLKNNNKLAYEDLRAMKYMDMVVSETLRKWPPAIVTDRKCVKKYSLPPPSYESQPFSLNVNDVVFIPIYAIHHNREYFANPEKFDPERFSDANKSSILPFTYMPFGLGPRNCIGSRFALMEIKAIIFYLLSKFDFVLTEKTANPLVLNKKYPFNLLPKGGGFYVGLKLRNK